MRVIASLPALRDLLDNRWHQILEPSLHLLDALDRELEFTKNVPKKELILRAFECDPSEVKAVIFGQDPYPNPIHAMGISFSVPSDIEIFPPSLRNIFKEMLSDVGGVSPKDGDLTYLAEQGVMLLNRGLSIKLPEKIVNPLWYQFTDQVARALAISGAVGIFWGNQAQELVHAFPETKRIQSAHPSPLSAYRGFFGSKPFSKANGILRSERNVEINWTKQ